MEAAGLGHLGKGYTVRQIEVWSTRYSKAKTWNVRSGKYVKDWLKDRRLNLLRSLWLVSISWHRTADLLSISP